MGQTISQIYPPAPRFTEQNVTDQSGKVFIVTGASSGVGKSLAQILYSKNAKVYLAGRSESRCNTAISQIQSAFPESTGSLRFLEIDLEDLESVRRAADSFMKQEQRLDALWNNAGVMLPPEGSKTKQGYELQMGSNTIASFLLTQLLTPLLAKTAKQAEAGSVRVLWVASSAAELFSPKGGVDMQDLEGKRLGPQGKYGASKGGMVLLSQEYAKKHKEDGIVSVSLNPGNLKTDLRRHLNWFIAIIFGWISHDPIKGAYTELYAGLSKDITLQNSGCWVIPWGRIVPVRKDISDGSKAAADGGTGLGQQFWDWCEAEVQKYREVGGQSQDEGLNHR